MIDFEWTDGELYDRARAFAARELEPGAAERAKEQRFERGLWERAAELGFAGLCVPRDHGGLGLGALECAHLLEALGRGTSDAGFSFSLGAHLFACLVPLVTFGSEAQKQRFLPELASGAAIGAGAISEANAGSDVFALGTRARKDGRDYVLDGEKSWVTNGPVADLFVVYAQTNPQFGYLGLSAFIVERDRAGLTLGKPIHKAGLETSPTSSLYLADCRVPEEHRLGQEGQGAPAFESAMLWERSCLFALYVGRMERDLERVVEQARSRRQFGKPLGDFQAVSHRIADMKLRLEAARLLLYRACWTIDRGRDARLEVALAKLAVSEAAVQSGLDAVQIFGGLGIVTEVGVERSLRDALPGRIVSGTSEIQRNLIARGLGL